MNNRIKQGVIPEDAWNQTSIELVAAAEAHCRAFVVRIFYEKIKQVKVSPELQKVLNQLVELYAVHTLLRCSGDLLRVSKLNTNKNIKFINCYLF